MYILYDDCLLYIINKLSIYNIFKLEQSSKKYKKYIEKYTLYKYKYQYTYILFKNYLFNYYNEIDILTNFININQSNFNNISLYYKSVNINNINNIINNIKYNYNYKKYILKILKFYFSIFNIIINNINITYIFFYKITKSKMNNNLYYIFINIKDTFINFYNFLTLYSYIKYFIYNNDNNYIKI